MEHLLQPGSAVDNLLATHEKYSPIATLDHIETVDDLTLKIYLTSPTPSLMSILSSYPTAKFAPATFEQQDAEIPCALRDRPL